MPTTVIVTVPNAPIAANSSAIFTGQFLDANGVGVPGYRLTALTLSLIDASTGATLNGLAAIPILNIDRGQVASDGTLTVTLLPSDTSMADIPGVPIRHCALVIDWASGPFTGRQQIDFTTVALAGA